MKLVLTHFITENYRAQKNLKTILKIVGGGARLGFLLFYGFMELWRLLVFYLWQTEAKLFFCVSKCFK